jgi:phosphate-selective porin OprO/OprP
MHQRCLRVLASAIPVVFLALGVRAAAQDTLPPPSDRDRDLEWRVRELEAALRQMQGQPSAQEPQADPRLPPAPDTGEILPEANSKDDGAAGGKDKAGGSFILAGWKDGFFLQSEKKDFVLRITGQIQTDYRAFLNDKDQTDIDTFLIRRARLGIEATMFKYYEFRLLPDFGQGRTVLQDAYMNVHYWDELQFEVGKFKQPFSYEQLIQDRFVPTVERSMIDQLVPARDEGIMLHGQKLFEDRFEFGLAVSNGEINGDADTNEHKDFNGRIAVRPFNSPEFMDFIHLLQIGISGGVGIEQEPVNPAVLRTPATVPWFTYNATVRADGVRSRLSPELSYFDGPFGFAAQYFRQEQELRPSAVAPGYAFRREVPNDGFYVLATWLVTGEQRTTYSMAIDPHCPFNPCCPCTCPGAWELVARVSHLEVEDNVFAPGPARLADPTKSSRAATELTLGFNWYLNKWVRTQFNWEHAWFQDPVQLGPTPANLTKHQDTLLTRFQIIF